MLLEFDGRLDPNLQLFPGGVEERLAKKFGNIYGNTWNGTSVLWIRVDDDTADEELERDNLCRNSPSSRNKENWAIGWAKVTAALVDHHQFGMDNHNWSSSTKDEEVVVVKKVKTINLIDSIVLKICIY